MSVGIPYFHAKLGNRLTSDLHDLRDVLTATGCGAVYRIARGWMTLSAGKPMLLPVEP
jgi:hypothetical protein